MSRLQRHNEREFLGSGKSPVQFHPKSNYSVDKHDKGSHMYNNSTMLNTGAGYNQNNSRIGNWTSTTMPTGFMNSMNQTAYTNFYNGNIRDKS